jgi:hypothetical protein
MALAPGRTGPVWTLSLFVGQDATAGIRGADTEARELAAGLVRSHPLFPDARPIAVDVALVMNDDDLARTWLRRQLAVFPVERAALSEDEARFVAGGPAPSRAGLVQTESADAET